MFIQQITMFGFFTITFGDRLWISFVVMISLQFVAVCLIECIKKSNMLKNNIKSWLSSNIM